MWDFLAAGDSLESCDQFLYGGDGQDGGLRARRGAKAGALDRNKTVVLGQDLDLAMPDVAGQTGKTDELERSTE
jgi:hypothetical protein